MFFTNFVECYHFQVSWTESHDTAATGKRTINFYDEEGTSAIRKVHTLSCCETVKSVTHAHTHTHRAYTYLTCKTILLWMIAVCSFILQSLRYGEEASAKPLFSADVDHRVSYKMSYATS